MRKTTIVSCLLLVMPWRNELLAQDSPKGSVVIHADPRFDLLISRKRPPVPKGQIISRESPGADAPRQAQIVVYSGKGYRVQIYYGPDRYKAIKLKTEFMRQHPGSRTYLTYTSPNFRVKVGNYRQRSDAEGMLREAKSSVSPCMIVPDIVTITNY